MKKLRVLIADDDGVLGRIGAGPAAIGNQLIACVHFQETDLTAFQTGNAAIEIPAQADEIMITFHDGAEGIGLGPVHGAAGTELLVLEHFLALEQHGHAGGGKGEGGGEK